MNQPTILKLHQILLANEQPYVVCPHQPITIGMVVIAPNPRTKALGYGSVIDKNEHSLMIMPALGPHTFMSPINKARKVILRSWQLAEHSRIHHPLLEPQPFFLDPTCRSVWVEMQIVDGMLIPNRKEGYYKLSYYEEVSIIKL